MEHKEVRHAEITLDEREAAIMFRLASYVFDGDAITSINLEDLGKFFEEVGDDLWLREANEDIEDGDLGLPADENEALAILEKLNNLFATDGYPFLNIKQLDE